jgi:tetratricopeptide (TPR) repeat protein
VAPPVHDAAYVRAAQAEAVTQAMLEAAPRRRRRRRQLAALAALALVMLALGVVAGAQSGGSPTPAAHREARSPQPATPRHRKPRTIVPAHRPATAQTAPATHTTPPPTTAAPPAPPSADVLEARGHQLLDGGSAASALPVLEQAVAKANPATLTYAYALYDLGVALVATGHPQAAIPILQRRLQIPNQTGVVRHELQLAMRGAGRPTGSGGVSAGPHGHRGRGD